MCTLKCLSMHGANHYVHGWCICFNLHEFRCNSTLLAVNLISSNVSSMAIGAHCGAELKLWLQLIGEENPVCPLQGEKKYSAEEVCCNLR